jgi:hypothetical protein
METPGNDPSYHEHSTRLIEFSRGTTTAVTLKPLCIYPLKSQRAAIMCVSFGTSKNRRRFN